MKNLRNILFTASCLAIATLSVGCSAASKLSPEQQEVVRKVVERTSDGVYTWYVKDEFEKACKDPRKAWDTAVSKGTDAISK